MQLFIPNHAKNLGSPPSGVTTGTSTKTMLQVKPLAALYIVEWGYFLSGSPSDITVELVEHDQAATVTTLTDSDITQLDSVGDAAAPSVFLTESTTGTGYTSSNEGTTPTVARNLDAPQITSLKAFKMPFALGSRPLMQIGKFTKIRVTSGTALNMLCYLKVSPSDK